ncbi:MAG: ATP-binding protein, partial [Bdellovibrionales bacterium]
MYKRILDLEAVLKRKSVFLLGPRQTGKSTYLKSQFKQAHFINLLKNSEYKDLLIDPSSLERRVKYAFEEEKKSIVIIDEIQKIPALLDEVHNLIEQNKSLRFILTGSSARKLKREGVNMLGGRASSYKMLPLCYPELGTGKYEKWLKRLNIGALPSIMDSDSPVEDLKDYVSLYLNEEIKAEGISRSIDNFARFLEFSALINGEQLNFTSIGSDAQLSPSTVRDYFEVLQDTLIGTTLPAFLQTKKRKAMATSKFYFFDCGVTNALLGRKEVVQGTPEYGKMLEQAIFLELQAYLNYKG